MTHIFFPINMVLFITSFLYYKEGGLSDLHHVGGGHSKHHRSFRTGHHSAVGGKSLGGVTGLAGGGATRSIRRLGRHGRHRKRFVFGRRNLGHQIVGKTVCLNFISLIITISKVSIIYGLDTHCGPLLVFLFHSMASFSRCLRY